MSTKLLTLLSKQKSIEMYGDTVQLLYLLCLHVRIYTKKSQCEFVNLLTKLLTHLFTERK